MAKDKENENLNATIPAEWNGKPTSYTLGQGFMESGIGMKVLYLITLPSLIVPAIVESNAYNEAKKNAAEARREIAAQQATSSASITGRKKDMLANGAALPEINPLAPQDGRFQDMAAVRAQEQVVRTPA